VSNGPEAKVQHRHTAAVIGVVVLMLAAIVAIALVSNARRGGLRADILGPRRVVPGERVDYTIAVRDTGGTLQRVEIDFGDGESAVPVRALQPGTECAEVDEPTAADVDVSHTYTRAGVFTAKIVVQTGGCGTRVEEVEAIRTIDVRPLRR
jgi:hypothetical protein